MNSRFDPAAAKKFIGRHRGFPKDLAFQAYLTRLLGGDPALVMHGGGNTSCKLPCPGKAGRQILYVKARGADMATIGLDGFCPLDLSALEDIKYRSDDLSDVEMEERLNQARLDQAGPAPSIETLLHAFLPHKYVDHTHAEAILILGGLKDGPALLRRALGPKVAVLPLIMSGHPLARAIYQAVRDQPDLEAVVVADHGIFTFHDHARIAYNRMIKYADRAEKYLDERLQHRPVSQGRTGAVALPPASTLLSVDFLPRMVQIWRGQVARWSCRRDGRLLRRQAVIHDQVEIVAATVDPDIERICQAGVMTPDHVIRTRNRYLFFSSPELMSDQALRSSLASLLERFQDDYAKYLQVERDQAGSMDLLPTVMVVRGAGLIGLGATRREAIMAADIADRTIRARLLARDVGGFISIADKDMVATELWAPERAKLAAGYRPCEGYGVLVAGSRLDLMEPVAQKYLRHGAAVMLAGLSVQSGQLSDLAAALAARYGAERVASVSINSGLSGWPVTLARACGHLMPGVDVAFILHESIEEGDLQHILSDLRDVFQRQGTGGRVGILRHEAHDTLAWEKNSPLLDELAALKVKVAVIPADKPFRKH